MLAREVIKKVKRIELVTRRLVNPQLAGQYHSVFKGRGMDFDEVQPYHEGDDVRFIDWNVSARTGELHIKRFVEERELTVQIIVDASSSMRFGTQEETKRAMAAQVAAVLAMLAIKNNDRVGLTIFDEDVDLYIPPKKGRKHVMRLVTEILDHKPRQSQTGLDAALSYVHRVTSRRAIIFVISDFLTDDYERSLKILARKHDVVPIVVRDPRELTLVDDVKPTGLFERLIDLFFAGGLLRVADLESGRSGWIDLNSIGSQSRFARKVEELDRERDRLFKRLKLDSIAFRTDKASEKDYVAPLASFFKRRSRRY